MFPKPERNGKYRAIAADGETVVELLAYDGGLPDEVYEALNDGDWPENDHTGRWFSDLLVFAREQEWKGSVKCHAVLVLQRV